MNPHRPVLVALALALVPLVVVTAAACTGAPPPVADRGSTSTTPSSATGTPGADTGTATEPAGANEATAAPTPLASALAVHGPAELAPDTVVIDPAAVKSVSGDATEFTLITDQTVAVGTVFVVPGVAARRVTTVTPLPTETAAADKAAVLVGTAQATLDEIFSDIDVTFEGEPDPAAMTFAEPPADAAGVGALGEYEPVPGFRRPPAALPASVAPPAPAALLAPVARPRPASPGASPEPGPPPCAGAPVGVGSPSVKAGPYAISASGSATPACRSISFAISASRKDTATITATLTGSATVGTIRGRVTNRAGQSSRLAVDLDANLAFSMSAATEHATIDKAKVTWDLIKIDIPVVLAGVPTVVRLGVPLTIEARFSGGADIVKGTLLTLTCKGTVTIASDSDTPKDTCLLQPIDVQQIMSIAPSGVVIAAGLKLGFGLGTAVKGKAVVFAGATATLAGAVGVTYSGGAGIPVTECTRLDRSVSLNFGGQVEVLGMTLSTSTPVWTKEATDQEGQRCRPAS